MRPLMDTAATKRLTAYFDRIGDTLGNPSRRQSFAMYAVGLLSEAERKSIEPLAALTCADLQRADAFHQRLLHFTTDARRIPPLHLAPGNEGGSLGPIRSAASGASL